MARKLASPGYGGAKNKVSAKWIVVPIKGAANRRRMGGAAVLVRVIEKPRVIKSKRKKAKGAS